MKRSWIKLSNGTRVRAELVAAVNAHQETLRIFLKSETGETLCAVQHEDEDAFKLELEDINKQLD